MERRSKLGCSMVWVLSLATFPLGACEDQAEPSAPAARKKASSPTRATRQGAQPVPQAWVSKRATKARERLDKSEAGKLVWEAIEAHGGLEDWLLQGTLQFEFDYQPLGKPKRRMHTLNKVDVWSAKAWQQEIVDNEHEGDVSGDAGLQAPATFGWNGDVAWIEPGPEAFPTPARFWATTPYYFVGIPWVMADPGTRFEKLEDAELDGTAHHVVKITYAEDTGDSPDDYYILYIHPRTKHVNAIRYVVAYPGFFPEGGHTPEKLMLYEKPRKVQGLRIAHHYTAYSWNAETAERGEKVTAVDISEVGLGKTWPASLFDPPDGAHIIEEIQTRK